MDFFGIGQAIKGALQMDDAIGLLFIIIMLIIAFAIAGFSDMDWETDILDYKIVSNGKRYKIKKLSKFFFCETWRDYGVRSSSMYSWYFDVIYFPTEKEAQVKLKILKGDLATKKNKEYKERIIDKENKRNNWC